MSTLSAGHHLRVVPSVVRTREDLEREVSHLSRSDTFVLDVETTHGHPKINEVSWVGFAISDRVIIIPMGHERGPMITPAGFEMRLPPVEERKVLKSGELSKAKKRYPVPAEYGNPGPQLRQDEVFSALRPILFSDRLKIGHNLKFDLQSVAKYYGEVPPGPYADTMILTHILDENLRAYGLKDLVMDWLKVHPKSRKEFYPNLGKLGIAEQPFDQVARYLAKDVWYTHLYYRDLRSKIDKLPELIPAFDLEMAVYPALTTMELNGIRIDIDALDRVGQELDRERAATAGRIWSIAGEQFSLTNNGEKRKWLFSPKKDGGQGLKPLTYTLKTATPQVDQKTLEHYADSNEMARLMLEWAEKDKLIQSFVLGLRQKCIDGKIHAGFSQHRTVTGRLSSSNPNLQQMPRDGNIRSTFIADPGCLLVVADYDQVELRCVAHLSNDAEMTRVFLEGLDIHAQAAAAMMRLDIAEVTKDLRQVGKTQNFGTLYGAGPQKLAAVANCSLEEAQEFIERYFRQFNGLAAWKDRQIVKARNNGSRSDSRRAPYAVVPPFGRRRRLPDLYSAEHKDRSRAERQVINSIVQGFAANVMKQALVDLHRELADTPYRLLLNVHDEVVLQAPENEVEDAKTLLVRVMEGVKFNGQPMLGSVPLTAAAGVGKSWAEAK